MYTFDTLHRVVTFRDRQGNDHVQSYKVEQYPTVDAAVAHLGEHEVLQIVNRAIADRAREVTAASLRFDIQNPKA